MSAGGDRLETRRAHPTPVRIVDDPRRGVNLIGLLEAESGLGEVARRVARSIERSGIPLAAIAHRDTESRQLHPHGLTLGAEALYDTNIVCLNPNQLPSFVAEAGAAFFARRYAVGIWFWETNRLRVTERNAARFFDELWVTSEYVRSAVESDVDVPVHVMPLPVEPPPGPFTARGELGLPSGFTFLFVFDFWSEERKNPAAVVEAFKRAFEPGEGPSLVLKSIHGRDWKPHQYARLRALADGREDIVLRDGYVSASERDSYIAGCDCYVSLHRSEGLGLTMAEAMALGKPVIATGYSGNLEFMNDANSYLVPYDLVEVPASWWAYEPGATWAEPDVDAAARLMRRVWERQDDAGRLGQRAREELLERFSPSRTADFVARVLDDPNTRGAIAARASIHDARPEIVTASHELDAGLGSSLAGGDGASPTSLVRSFLRRALWPQLEEQRRVDSAVLEAVSSLQRSIEDVGRRIERLERSSESARSADDGHT
jgi:glycosyltransferase involved in cell wall biosynthesis